MILVTGATGFVGQRVVARLAAAGRDVRCLVRPSYKLRRLPPGVRVHVVAGDLADSPALRVALQDVDTIVHLAAIWVERGGRTFESVNYHGTLNLVEAAQEVGASRLIFLSYPGADRNSAYPFLRGKGLAEEAVKSSGLDYTILRPSLVYGLDDGWTTNIAMTLKSVPFIFPVVGDGQTRLQPLWVQDLAVCIEQCLDNRKTSGHIVALGGPGYLTLNEVLDIIMRTLRVRRRKVSVRVPLARSAANTMGRMMLQPFLSTTMVDMLGVDMTTTLDAVPRHFGFEPARFADTVDYLCNQPWRRRFLRRFFSRRP
jgi:NADH dehydrogenase